MTDQEPIEPDSIEGGEAEAPPVAELLQGDWDRGQVLALFADLEAGAEIQSIRLRRQLASGGGDGPVTLEQAKAAFVSGQAMALQIKYVFAGVNWCDTLMPGADGARIIRTKL